jgi:hypothetical protein
MMVHNVSHWGTGRFGPSCKVTYNYVDDEEKDTQGI